MQAGDVANHSANNPEEDLAFRAPAHAPISTHFQVAFIIGEGVFERSLAVAFRARRLASI